MTDIEMRKLIASMRASFNMTKQRCLNPNCRDYRYYGGRGIAIDRRWIESFDNFLQDMGVKPSKYHTLERIDNDGPYCKANCVWADRYEQAANRRANKLITYLGETHTISDWERLMGFKAGTLKARIGRLGYSIEEAFEKPVKCGGVLPNKDYPKVEASKEARVNALLRAKKKQPALTHEMIEEAKTLVASGMSRSAVGRKFGVTTTTISSAVDNLRAYNK